MLGLVTVRFQVRVPAQVPALFCYWFGFSSIAVPLETKISLVFPLLLKKKKNWLLAKLTQ